MSKLPDATEPLSSGQRIGETRRSRELRRRSGIRGPPGFSPGGPLSRRVPLAVLGLNPATRDRRMKKLGIRLRPSS